jgi:hypothetical protein
MYFPTLEASGGRLLKLEWTAMRIARFRLNRASDEQSRWLAARLEPR